MPSFAGNEPSLNLRYWSTSTYEGIHFNDYIYFNLKSEILNRVIINGQSGSSWFFRKFNSISLEELIGNYEGNYEPEMDDYPDNFLKITHL